MQKYTFLRDSRHNHRVIAARKVHPYGTFQTGCRSLHSFAFYFGTAVGDWTDPQNADLWRDESKTLFDPCPSGWRVPKSGTGELSPWNSFTVDNGPLQGNKTTAGRLFDNSAVQSGSTWYPTSGYREASRYYYPDGRLFGVTAYCHTRSASIVTEDIYIFHYNFGSVYPSHTYSRASGLSVRCVRE